MSSKQNQLVIKQLLKSKGLDETLSLAGNFNFYQWKVMIFLGLQWFITAFVVMIQPFLNQLPDFICEGSNGEWSSCTEEQATNSGCHIDWADSPSSLVISLGLYCDQAYMRTLAQCLFFGGGSLGTLFLSRVGDKNGRKPAMVISYAIGAVSFLILALYETNPVVYLILLSICWAGYDPYFAFSLIILNENGGQRVRQISNPWLLLNWGFGEIIFVILAYYIQNYQIEMIYVIAIPCFLMMAFFLWIKESPRYLMAKNKIDDAAEVLEHIALQNNKTDLFHCSEDESPEIIQNHSQEAPPESSEQSENTIGYMVIFKNRKVFKLLVLYSLVISYLYIAYHGILFGLNYLQGSLYTNSLVSSIAETSAYAVSIYVIPKYPRKTLLKYLLFVGSTFGVLFQFISVIQPICSSYSWCTDDMLTAIFCLFLKFCNAFSFGLIYIYGSEIFPTVVRAKCMGASISFGRGVSTIAPYMNVIAANLGLNPMFIYGVGGLLCLPLLAMLPETIGKDMPDFLEQAEDAKKETDNDVTTNSDIQDISAVNDYTRL